MYIHTVNMLQVPGENDILSVIHWKKMQPQLFGINSHGVFSVDKESGQVTKQHYNPASTRTTLQQSAHSYRHSNRARVREHTGTEGCNKACLKTVYYSATVQMLFEAATHVAIPSYESLSLVKYFLVTCLVMVNYSCRFCLLIDSPTSLTGSMERIHSNWYALIRV